jgi:hypothetical protein
VRVPEGVRERVNWRGRNIIEDTLTHTHTHTHTHIYIYKYIYIYKRESGERVRERETGERV